MQSSSSEQLDLPTLSTLRVESQARDLPLSACGPIIADDEDEDLDQLTKITIRRAGVKDNRRRSASASSSRQSVPSSTVSTPTTTMISSSTSSTSSFTKVQDIFLKYNLILESADWHYRPTSRTDRVKKSTRVRVKRVCHKCNTTFQRSRTCAVCQHEKCRECARLPCLKPLPVENPQPYPPEPQLTPVLAIAGERRRCYERLHGRHIEPRSTELQAVKL